MPDRSNHTHMQTHTYVCMHACTQILIIHTYICRRTYLQCTCTYTHTHKRTRMHTHSNKHMHTHTHVHTRKDTETHNQHEKLTVRVTQCYWRTGVSDALYWDHPTRMVRATPSIVKLTWLHTIWSTSYWIYVAVWIICTIVLVIWTRNI